MIDSYEFGEIIVDGKSYVSDVIIYPDRIDDKWWRKDGHKLSIEDVKDIMNAKPEMLIVGTGYSGFLEITSRTKRFLETNGVELLAANTKKACQKYNEISKTKRVVAAFHLTC
ncbi:MAG: Mth938-like domain-containing protein [Candidatus Eisenbacteria bacterium]|nr:Mth938-like domain-containing protein [Candidatus Eisenbacteria bacterium]